MRSDDYTGRVPRAVVTLVVLLVAVSFIPPFDAGGISLRRANILSSLVQFSDASPAESTLEIDLDEYDIDFSEVADAIASAVDTTRTAAAMPSAPDLDSLPRRRAVIALPDIDSARQFVAIEDFDSTGIGALDRFYRKLLRGTEPVRIAVMGDSFVEGDILTQDLREELQSVFGGCGAGFAPAASPLTAFRRSIKTQSRGWQTYNIMQRRSTPEPLRSDYFVSGWVCRPDNGATVRWDMTGAKAHAAYAEVARIALIARRDARLLLTINGSRRETVELKASDAVQHITLRDSLLSLSLEVAAGADAMTVYGASFEGANGVVVDNYSVRSNNGQALLWTSPSVDARMDAAAPYDLVILQYGLNILQEGVTDYSRYGAQIEKIITFVRRCFPRAAVVVMGVSDRSVRKEQGFVPMQSAHALTRHQRQAAKNCGAAFWNTHAAMQLHGGMKAFVANGWAGKDYTHINFAGGRVIAQELAQAVIRHAAQIVERIPEGHDLAPSALNQTVPVPIIDERRRASAEKRLYEHAPNR